MNIRWIVFAFATVSTACSAPAEKVDEQPTEEVVAPAEPAVPVATETPEGITIIAESAAQWTGVAAVDERVYVNFPRWSEKVPVSVGYLDEGGAVVPFPNASWQTWKPGDNITDKFVSVQSVVPAPDGQVWVLDTGNPGFQGIYQNSTRLFRFDESGNKTAEIYFIDSVEPQSYTNDIRFDYERNRAYVTDSGVGGLIVVDLETESTYRALDGHPSTMATDTVITIDGEKWLRNGEPPKVHADGIALHDGFVYYQALSGRTLYRISQDMLERGESEEARAEAVETLAEVGPSDGLIAGPDGSIYLSSLEQNAVRVYRPDGTIETIAQDELIAWPDSFSWAPNGDLLVTTSRIHQGAEPKGKYGVLRISM